MESIATTLDWHHDILASAKPTAATLVVGHAGAGAHHLALALAFSFVGESAESTAVANLIATKSDSEKKWFADKNADILIIRPDKGSIPVDATRRIIEFCGLSPVALSRRIAVVLEAECMNAAAANALLKTLEEPAEDKSLILAAHSASMLPPTIVSRCQIVVAPPPTNQEAAAWLRNNGGNEKLLAFCGGLPLAVMQAEADSQKINAATKLFATGKNLNIATAAKEMQDFDEWLDCLQKWVADSCRAAAGLKAQYFPGAEQQQRNSGVSLRRWLDYYTLLLQKRRLASHPLSRDLFIKEILHDYRALFLD
ncbi:MAG: hypothetical protein ACNYPH_05290 [Gammaproteobacteria bacterium WSBS_2016_MAG_OTU1]